MMGAVLPLRRVWTPQVGSIARWHSCCTKTLQQNHVTDLYSCVNLHMQVAGFPEPISPPSRKCSERSAPPEGFPEPVSPSSVARRVLGLFWLLPAASGCFGMLRDASGCFTCKNVGLRMC